MSDVCGKHAVLWERKEKPSPLATFAGLLAFLVCLWGVAGCGGKAAPTTTITQSGRATLTVRWPERTRLIPFAANSIRVTLTSPDASRQFGSALLIRPENGGLVTASFERLPVGTVRVEASAFPTDDGTGVVQATAQTTATIVANEIAQIRLTLASTIDRVEVTPTALSLSVNQTASLTATTKTAGGEVVITDSSTISWVSQDTTVATVAASGVVTAVAAGTTHITVTEIESGKSALVPITVTGSSGNVLMYVSSIANHSIKVYDPATGAYLRDLVPAGSNMERPQEMVFGPDNRLYVSGYYVTRFDATTGAYLDDFVPSGSGGLNNACGMMFGKDGHLLVCSAWSNEVKRYNGQTGEYMGNFLTGNGLDVPHDLAYGPDGMLYVCSNYSSEVKRYNPDTGAFLGNFVTAGSGGLNGANHLAFGPDGNLYVTSFWSAEVKRYNGQTGAFLGTFVTSGSGGLASPTSLAFGPDGNLYVCSKDTHRVKRYNGQTGAYMNDIDPGNAANLNEPWGIVFH